MKNSRKDALIAELIRKNCANAKKGCYVVEPAKGCYVVEPKGCYVVDPQ